MLTAATLPALLLLLAAAFAPMRIKPFVLGAMMTFHDAALILKPVPVSVAWVGLLALSLLCFRPTASGFVRAAGSVWGLIIIAIIAYDLFAIFAAANLFEGAFLTMPSESNFMVSLARPIGFVASHVNQFGYLCLGVFCALCFGAWCHETHEPERFGRIQAALLGYVGCVCFLCLWEWLGKSTGLFFPSAILHSGAPAAAWMQKVAGFTRLAGPFSEPSGLAMFLAISAAGLAPGLFIGNRRPACFCAMLMAIVILLRSTSTTAYGLAPLVFFIGVGASAYSQGWLLKRGIAPGKALKGLLITIGSGSVILLLMIQLAIALVNSPAYAQLLDKVIFNKTRTGSFVNRILSNELGVDAFINSIGIGVGLGGHVANSGVVTLAACLGFFGLIVYGLLLGNALLAPLRVGERKSADADLGTRLTAACLAFIISVSFAAAGAIVTHVWIWITFGLALGLAGIPVTGRLAAPPPPGWIRRKPA
jgi:hypothetical protein